MKNTIFSIYLSFSKKTDIVEITSWSPGNLIKNILILLKSKPTKESHFFVYKKSLPGNRFLFIQKINKKLFKFMLSIIIRQFRTIKILWISDPDYYKLHNNVDYKYLVFSCLPNIICDKNRDFFYKKLFIAGWIFVYNFEGEYKASLLKNLSENAVVQTLATKKIETITF
jgi:hypothetical protein